MYISTDRKVRIYGDMSASDWWWKEMEKMARQGKRDATIVPVIIATDQTTLSIMCGGQKAYPVYVSFGNLDKDWRRKPSKRGMYLLGYLPVDAFEDVSNDEERRRLKADLVHRAMEQMLMPLRKASEEGVEMWCPDGRLRRVYPRVAAYTADWPEQNLQACTSEGGCPICKATYSERGAINEAADLREREETLDAFRKYFLRENPIHLKPLGLKPVWPWWGDIPDVNLSACLTPDLLHQAYQGVFKTHLVRWMKHIFGVDVLDNRFAAMPGAEGLTHFTKGISKVSQWTGRQSKQLLAQFLPAVVGGLTPELAEMVRVLVDFMYRSHASSLTDEDLESMEQDLRTFHELKDLLVLKGVYQSPERFNKIPKLHMLRHWVLSIRELGTPDGYNTEAPEHLHIEYAKVPWRASNKVRPLAQMVTYIQRQEAIRKHRKHLDQYFMVNPGEGESPDGGEEVRESEEVELEDVEDLGRGIEDGAVGRSEGSVGEVEIEEGPDEQDVLDPIAYPTPSRQMSKHPTKKKVPLWNLMDKYGASNIIRDTTNFLNCQLGIDKRNILLSPNNHVQVWHKLYLYHSPPSFAPFDPPRRDVVRARPPVLGAAGRVHQPAAWDIALYLEKPNRSWRSTEIYEKHGINRYRAGRVRALFTLPSNMRFYYPGQLAYLELFTPFDASVSPFTKLHSTKPDYRMGIRQTMVVPVTDIVFAAHLVPKFHMLDDELEFDRYTDLLEIGRNFWLNHYYNHHFYRYIHYWRRRRFGLQQRLHYNVQRSQHPNSTSSMEVEDLALDNL
ncbi:unnamed protein product [Rhizoctonia solani]|uniref:Uncharacterized protein n=1 Tax=Rhizoctonia solani TaxID=456999 RepID=A0A8H2XIR6_9AGAM|nr:unnamed protein product [Rhizoctonia solani]CAE6429966.1 unnamed protein product [Rhizoctonia solani]